MNNSLLVHTQDVRQFDFLRWSWEGDRAVAFIKHQKRHFHCPTCHSSDVTATAALEEDESKALKKAIPPAEAENGTTENGTEFFSGKRDRFFLADRPVFRLPAFDPGLWPRNSDRSGG